MGLQLFVFKCPLGALAVKSRVARALVRERYGANIEMLIVALP